MPPQVADMLFGAALMYWAGGVFTFAVILYYDIPPFTWRLVLLPPLALCWPYFVWRAIAAYHGRG